jgi:hypothetical protein
MRVDVPLRSSIVCWLNGGMRGIVKEYDPVEKLESALKLSPKHSFTAARRMLYTNFLTSGRVVYFFPNIARTKIPARLLALCGGVIPQAHKYAVNISELQSRIKDGLSPDVVVILERVSELSSPLSIESEAINKILQLELMNGKQRMIILEQIFSKKVTLSRQPILTLAGALLKQEWSSKFGTGCDLSGIRKENRVYQLHRIIRSPHSGA